MASRLKSPDMLKCFGVLIVAIVSFTAQSANAIDLLRIPPISCNGLQFELDRIKERAPGAPWSADGTVSNNTETIQVRAEDLFGAWTGYDHLGRPFVLELAEDFQFNYRLKIGPRLELTGFYAIGERGNGEGYAIRFGFERIITASKSMAIFGSHQPKIARISSLRYGRMKMMAIRAEVSSNGHDYTFGLSEKEVEYSRNDEHPSCSDIRTLTADYENNTLPLVAQLDVEERQRLLELGSIVEKLAAATKNKRETSRDEAIAALEDLFSLKLPKKIRQNPGSLAGFIAKKLIKSVILAEVKILVLEYKANEDVREIREMISELERREAEFNDALFLFGVHERGAAECRVFYNELRKLDARLLCQ